MCHLVHSLVKTLAPPFLLGSSLWMLLKNSVLVVHHKHPLSHLLTWRKTRILHTILILKSKSSVSCIWTIFVTRSLTLIHSIQLDYIWACHLVQSQVHVLVYHPATCTSHCQWLQYATRWHVCHWYHFWTCKWHKRLHMTSILIHYAFRKMNHLDPCSNYHGMALKRSNSRMVMRGHSWRMVIKSTWQDMPRVLLVILSALVIVVVKSCPAYTNSVVWYSNKTWMYSIF